MLVGFWREEFQTVSIPIPHCTNNRFSMKNKHTKKQTQRTGCVQFPRRLGENCGSHPTLDLKYTPLKQQEEMKELRTSLHQTLSQDGWHLQALLDTRIFQRDD